MSGEWIITHYTLCPPSRRPCGSGRGRAYAGGALPSACAGSGGASICTRSRGLTSRTFASLRIVLKCGSATVPCRRCAEACEDTHAL
jgi:hypothetical protein